jgi:hypothetical protein
VGIFSAWSGWDGLQRRYPAPAVPTGTALSGQTVQVNAVRFRRCTNVVICTEELYLQPRLFYGTYQAILIPWSEFRSVEPARLYWLGARRLAFGLPEAGQITVWIDLYRHLEPHLGHVAVAA